MCRVCSLSSIESERKNVCVCIENMYQHELKMPLIECHWIKAKTQVKKPKIVEKIQHKSNGKHEQQQLHNQQEEEWLRTFLELLERAHPRARQREKEKQEVRHSVTHTILSIPDKRKIQEDEIVTHTHILPLSQSTGSGLLRLWNSSYSLILNYQSVIQLVNMVESHCQSVGCNVFLRQTTPTRAFTLEW